MPMDKEFLKIYFAESQADMRWRRDLAYKFHTMHISICILLVSAQALIYDRMCSVVSQIWVATSVFVFTGALAFALSWMVYREHAIHKTIGECIVRVWDYFEMFEPHAYGEVQLLPNECRSYGSGSGYRRAITIFCIVSGATTVISFVLACTL